MKTMKVVPKKEMEAIIYDGSNIGDIREFCGEENVSWYEEEKLLDIFMGESGWLTIFSGYVVMKDVDGESLRVFSRETFDKYFKVADDENKIITISRKKNCIGEDEIYCMMYECPTCKATITQGSSFCPDCGSEIKWVK